MYENRNPPEEPPCRQCRVELMENNRLAADIYPVVRNQVITNGATGQVVDISIPAIKAVMDMFRVDIKEQKSCLMKVRRLFHVERSRHAG